MLIRNGAGRIVALGLASAGVVVSAGGSALAASPHTTTTSQTLYSATTSSTPLQLTITLPAATGAVTGQLPAQLALPSPLTLSVIQASGVAAHDGVAADTSTSMSSLLAGSAVDSSALSPVLGALKRSVAATLPNNTTYTDSVGAAPANPLTLTLSGGSVSATSTLADRSNSSAGNLASIGLLSLSAIGVPSSLQTALNGVTAALGTAAAQAAPITSALAGVPSVTVPSVASPLAPVTGALGAVPVLGSVVAALPTSTPAITLDAGQITNQLSTLPTQLNAVINQLLNGPLISVGAGTATQAIHPLGTMTRSEGAANPADINLIGGLITVTAGKATASADATGTAGKATADGAATAVKIAVNPEGSLMNLLTLIAGDQGLAATLSTTGLPDVGQQALLGTATTALTTALNSAVSQLTGVLSMLGSGAQVLNQGTVTKTTSPDGTHAESVVHPAAVQVGVPGAANLVGLTLGAVDVVANRRTVTTTTTAPAAPKAPVKKAVPVVIPKLSAGPPLAFTGADLPLSAGIAGLLLLGAGALARRHRRTAAAPDA